jgi:polyhydroxybutyrate depolymerase
VAHRPSQTAGGFGLSLAVVFAVVLAGCGSSTKPVAVATPAVSGCPSATPATTVAGAPLDTILRVPEANRGRRVPLVVALHFATGSGAAMERNTGLTEEAKRAGFDIAYPTATAANRWWTPPDLPRLRRTIAAIERSACIDRSRVYLVGWSNGGTAAVRAACELREPVAAVVLFAAAVNAARSCTPARTPSLLEIHGTADPLWPYPRARAFVAAWAADNDCGSPTKTRVGKRGTLYRWTGCKDGATFEHLRVAGARHIELFTDLRAAGIDPLDTTWRFLEPFTAR